MYQDFHVVLKFYENFSPLYELFIIKYKVRRVKMAKTVVLGGVDQKAWVQNIFKTDILTLKIFVEQFNLTLKTKKSS